jgi:long-chain acyl-CoA synthetase
MGMRLGGMNVLIPNPRDIPASSRSWPSTRSTVFPAVNTLYNGLLNNPDFAKLDFSSYKICNGGGMAVQQAVADRWLKITGTPIIEGYGLSETSPVATANRCDIKEFTGTIGLPYPIDRSPRSSTTTASRCRWATRRDRDPRPAGDGRLLEARRRNGQGHDADGFFKTGDIGIMDERGYTKIVDRKKDMILVSGFNVYPNEVEGVVAAHPGVLEVACIGVPDKNSAKRSSCSWCARTRT